MLKFIKQGEGIKFVLRDEDDEIRPVDKKIKSYLNKLGIIVERTNVDEPEQHETDGVSQDDLAYLAKRGD